MVSEPERGGEASDFAWDRLRAHAERLRAKRPGKAWSREGRALIDELGEGVVVAELVAGLKDADATRGAARIPEGFIALAGLVVPQADLAAALGDLAERSYR